MLGRSIAARTKVIRTWKKKLCWHRRLLCDYETLFSGVRAAIDVKLAVYFQHRLRENWWERKKAKETMWLFVSFFSLVKWVWVANYIEYQCIGRNQFQHFCFVLPAKNVEKFYQSEEKSNYFGDSVAPRGTQCLDENRFQIELNIFPDFRSHGLRIYDKILLFHTFTTSLDVWVPTFCIHCGCECGLRWYAFEFMTFSKWKLFVFILICQTTIRILHSVSFGSSNRIQA